MSGITSMRIRQTLSNLMKNSLQIISMQQSISSSVCDECLKTFTHMLSETLFKAFLKNHHTQLISHSGREVDGQGFTTLKS